MAKGTLILESLAPGSELDKFQLKVSMVSRGRARLSPTQKEKGLPDLWCAIDFEVLSQQEAELAERLSQLLEPFGWYVNMESPTEAFVIFAKRVFRYKRGDPERRKEAQEYGRLQGVPDWQLDWPV